MPSAMATNVGPMSLARNNERSICAPPPGELLEETCINEPGRLVASQLIAYHRTAWCAIQWRAWLGEAHRTGRGFVAGRPCIDPLKRRHGCREYLR